MTLELDLIKALAKIGIRVDFHPPQLLAGEVALARNLAYPALNSAMKLLLTCHSTLPIVLTMPINDLPAFFCSLSLVLFHVVLIVLLKGRFCMQCHY